MTSRIAAAISLPREIAKGIAPNAVFSALVAYAILGRGVAIVPVGAIALDMGPQSAMIAFATVLVAGATMRRAGLVADRRLPRTLSTAIGVGVAIGVLGAALGVLLLPAVSPPSWSVTGLLVFKAAYGATLGAVLTVLALRLAARDRAGRLARS